MMAVRQLHWLTLSACRRIETLLGQRLAPWQAQWKAALPRLRCRPAWTEAEQAGRPWSALVSGAGRTFWQHGDESFDDALCRALFDLSNVPAARARASRLARGVVEAARRELLGCCLDALEGGEAEDGEGTLAQQFRPSHGAALLDIGFDDATLTLLLPAGLLPRAQRVRRAPGAPLDTLAMALRCKPVRLALEAGSIELSVARLQELRLGDVVTLPSRIESPLALSVADGGPRIGQAHLGRRSQYKAIKLTKELA